MQSSDRAQSISQIIEQKRILSLTGVEIEPCESEHEGIQVIMRFKAAGIFMRSSPLIVTEQFADDAEAMTYVLSIFDLLVSAGLAQREDVIQWRRSLIVLV